jgi:hypothetical protein
VVAAVLRVYVRAYHEESNDVERGWPQNLIGQTYRRNVLLQRARLIYDLTNFCFEPSKILIDEDLNFECGVY